jgi:hypothetical protein
MQTFGVKRAVVARACLVRALLSVSSKPRLAQTGPGESSMMPCCRNKHIKYLVLSNIQNSIDCFFCLRAALEICPPAHTFFFLRHLKTGECNPPASRDQH